MNATMYQVLEELCGHAVLAISKLSVVHFESFWKGCLRCLGMMIGGDDDVSIYDYQLTIVLWAELNTKTTRVRPGTTKVFFLKKKKNDYCTKLL
eukprot:SAG11_NODE_2827_length_2936_cov_5.348608_2_plen_94_part_00